MQVKKKRISRREYQRISAGETYSVTELAGLLGLCERTTRIALRAGDIPSIRVGKRYILPRSAIAEWMKSAGGNNRAWGKEAKS